MINYNLDGEYIDSDTKDSSNIDYWSESANYGYKIPDKLTNIVQVKGWYKKAKEINDIKTEFKTSGYGESAYKLYSLMKSNNIVTKKQLTNAIGEASSEDLGDVKTWEYKNIKEPIREQMKELANSMNDSGLITKIFNLRGKEFDMSVMAGWKPKSKILNKK